MKTDELRARARIMKALSSPVRLRIVDELSRGERCMCELQPLFTMNKSTLSRHIAELRHVGIIGERRDGVRTYLSLLTPCILNVFDCTMGVIRAEVERKRGVLGEPALPDGNAEGEGKVGRDLRARRPLPKRRRLPHAVPAWVSQDARFFITINCRKRGVNTLCGDSVAQALLESARAYEKRGRWYLWLMLLMPDHVHFIVSFGPDNGLRSLMGQWKRFQASHHDIEWQANFFDHRLRNQEEFNEKAHYIRMNPVRKGLVDSSDAWRFVIDRTSGALGEPALPDGADR